jgi:N-terminal domain of reverse transcriptase
VRRPCWSHGQPGVTARLRRCPAPGVERPTRPTPLASAERGNPVAVWRHPVTSSPARANAAAGTGRLTPPRPARRNARGRHHLPDGATWRPPTGGGRAPGDRPQGRGEGPATSRQRSLQRAATVTSGDQGDWPALAWKPVDRPVKHLRPRICRASRDGELKRVRSLPRLLRRGRATVFESVRRVTQVNQGKDTPGGIRRV